MTEADGLFKAPRFSRIACNAPFGVDFLSQRDLFLVRPIAQRIVGESEFLFVKEGTLMLGSRGQVTDGGVFGKIQYIDGIQAKNAFSEDILRMSILTDWQHVAYAFLSTRVGMQLLKTTAVGTSIPSMHLDLLRDLPFPDLSTDLHTRVTQHVQQAMTARAAATTAEREAIRIVEKEVLPQWLA